jgi:hypothetical protein
VSLKFYLDEDSADSALVNALRSRGFEVVTPDGAALLGADDVTQLDFCRQHGCVLVTHNIADFYRLHGVFLAEGKSHSGIILMRQQTLGVGEKLRRLVKIAHARSSDVMKDRVEFLSNW